MKISRLIGLLEAAYSQDCFLMKEGTKSIIQLTILELTDLKNRGIEELDEIPGLPMPAGAVHGTD
ncbi:hypothetical protein LCGC14_2605010 [marine sediment metagenome]|uniref:Uncharacterized protein n=1 Tax=marine sediment metagenome TaxID=412755 RepID=A0A0F9A7J2_9ZZZZ